MQILTFDTYEQLSTHAATELVDLVAQKPNAVLCLATGDTPRLTYNKVVEMAQTRQVDFSQCAVVALDEWAGIPPDNNGSCHAFLHEYLFNPLKINASQICLFDALTTDPAAECARVNTWVTDHDGIDLMVVGIGVNGHIGFNEPGIAWGNDAHLADLAPITRTVGQKYFATEVPIEKGFTVGLRQVAAARRLLLLANGPKKAEIIRLTAEGEIGAEVPSTILRQHPNSALLIDSAAASLLNA